MARWLGIWLNSCFLRKAIKQAKHQYRDKVDGSDIRRMWQGLQTITVTKGMPADADVLLPEELNTFFAANTNQGWEIPVLKGLIGVTVLPQPQLTHLTPIIT